MEEPLLAVRSLSKAFTLHLQGGVVIPVLERLDLDLLPGECLVLTGPSGQGKSTLLKLLHGSYRALEGSISLRHDGAMVELVDAEPRLVLEVRRRTLGYVSQFLRVVPRVPALDIVAEPLLALGVGREEAGTRAAELLARLNIPERLWALPPATFSGGEQQRVNIARGLAHPYPVLLLDEPTASLDATNRAAVVSLIEEAKRRGAGVVAICHDEDVRERIATRFLDLARHKAAA
jgi:alpha-D-ribose 1-methylphosphonate 5-triphosphate synthase subunit PhnL